LIKIQLRKSNPKIIREVNPDICTFMRCGHLTYDPWIWLKVISMASTASVLNDDRISLEIPSFYSEFFFSKTSK
jgi:hypothetical protein